MCLNPQTIRKQNEPPVEVPCRNCKRCRGWRVGDLVGRCIAEQQSSTQTVAVTLTYRGDVPSAALLDYSDIQRFLKRMRKAGHKLRYIVAGEYGSKRGRAHWHMVLFLNGTKTLNVEYDKRITFEHWPHGYAMFQRPDEGAFGYVLKYVLKDQSAQVQRTHLAMSKKPPLGYTFFMQRAQSLARQQLAPQTPEYAFSGIKNPDGTHRQFWLRGRMKEMFQAAFIEAWQQIHPGRILPLSDFMLEYEDREAKKEMEAERIAQFGQAERIAPPVVKTLVEMTYGAIIEVLSDGTCLIDLEGTDLWRSQDTESALDEVAEKAARLRLEQPTTSHPALNVRRL